MKESKTLVLGDRRRYRRPRDRIRRRLIAIILVVAALSYVAWALKTMDQGTRVRQALVDISRIEHAARLFRADHGRCPDDLNELVDPAAGRPYLQSITDPWGVAYRMVCPARQDPGGVVVLSHGPDRNPAGDDDISSL